MTWSPPLATLGERARNAALTLATSAALVAAPPAAMARLEGVNNPQMLPPGEPVEVLDVAGYLTKGEIARLTSEVRNLEKDTASASASSRKPTPTPRASP